LYKILDREGAEGGWVSGGVYPPHGVGSGILILKWWVFVHSGWYYLPFTCMFYMQKRCFWSWYLQT